MSQRPEGYGSRLSGEDHTLHLRLLLSALVLATVAATAGCSQAPEVSGKAKDHPVAPTAEAARNWDQVESDLEQPVSDKTRRAIEEASRGDPGAQGSVAPDTIRAGQ